MYTYTDNRGYETAQQPTDRLGYDRYQGATAYGRNYSSDRLTQTPFQSFVRDSIGLGVTSLGMYPYNTTAWGSFAAPHTTSPYAQFLGSGVATPLSGSSPVGQLGAGAFGIGVLPQISQFTNGFVPTVAINGSTLGQIAAGQPTVLGGINQFGQVAPVGYTLGAGIPATFGGLGGINQILPSFYATGFGGLPQSGIVPTAFGYNNTFGQLAAAGIPATWGGIGQTAQLAPVGANLAGISAVAPFGLTGTGIGLPNTGVVGGVNLNATVNSAQSAISQTLGYQPGEVSVLGRGVNFCFADNDSEYIYETNASSFDKKNVDVTIIGNEIRVRPNYNSAGISKYQFFTLQIPFDANPSKITASFEGENFVIHIPKQAAVVSSIRKVKVN